MDARNRRPERFISVKRIKLLPENLINQIAAGEVIERPSSIVKELVENSIDAGANKIEVEISNECRNIRVADNGHGIDKEDIELAFSRHATSKLTQEKDLWNISTLGFRGEALASIISVSKVSCLSRTSESQTGIKADCENSEIKFTETGCAVGTIMEVKELFYNVPARLKFLKKSQTELASIIEIIQGIAISHPEISISLIHKGSISLKTTGSNDLATTISEVYSRELIKELIEVHKQDTQANLEVKGFASSPEFTKSNKKAIYLFINNRTVKCPLLSKAIDNAYKDLIPSGRFPFVVLNLLIPYDQIDVNVHPSKKEVRYSNPNQIFSFVHAAIKTSLQQNLGYQQVNIQDNTDFPNISKAEKVDLELESKETVFTKKDFSIDFSDLKQKTASSREIEESIKFYTPISMKLEKEPVQTILDFTDFKTNETSINKPKIIGQFSNTYILIENPEGLEIIDQHIAHERAIYEKLKTTKNYTSQMLLLSENIELEAAQIAILEENKEILLKFGYEFQAIENKAIILKQIPQILTNKDPKKIINDLLESLEENLENIEEKILITTACHAAVKAGERLSFSQMEELIIEWRKTDFPKTCPHGRKISHIIPTKNIAGFFGR